mmetsp:Transcript_14885/g.35082  ORF Transcript_14885/g.35082 Transcript_14885/m.35082 type:complete len:216 (+) Transcript_14885:151-798(+)
MAASRSFSTSSITCEPSPSPRASSTLSASMQYGQERRPKKRTPRAVYLSASANFGRASRTAWASTARSMNSLFSSSPLEESPARWISPRSSRDDRAPSRAFKATAAPASPVDPLSSPPPELLACGLLPAGLPCGLGAPPLGVPRQRSTKSFFSKQSDVESPAACAAAFSSRADMPSSSSCPQSPPSPASVDASRPTVRHWRAGRFTTQAAGARVA